MNLKTTIAAGLAAATLTACNRPTDIISENIGNAKAQIGALMVAS